MRRSSRAPNANAASRVHGVPVPNVSPVGINIQIVGRWNPALFVPRWFADVGLLPKEEVDEAKLSIVHEEIAQFDVGWLALRVTRDRFVGSTSQIGHAEALRDLVVGTLELLTHTPTRVVGVNHDFLFSFKDRESFDAFGWVLVSPAPWPQLERPGMAALQVQGMRTDKREGYVRVMLDPLLDGTNRVAVGVNDHYAIADQDSSRSTAEIAGILSTRWFDSAREAEEIVATMRKVVR